MNVTLTGATGFLGKHIVAGLLEAGHRPHLLGRNPPANLPPGVAFSLWRSTAVDPPREALQSANAIIHLVGEPVAQRWSPEVKSRIRSSRVAGTLQLAEALAAMPNKPQVVVSASAIGIYGERGDDILTESSPPGQGFLADVCREWERSADRIEVLGIRAVKLRIGIVLGKGGGALDKMLPPFRLGAGGKLGSGRQWMSWIHIDDIAGLFRFAIENPTLSGPVNATAPSPVTNAAFTRELAHSIHRPAFFPVPEFALRALYGEMASMVLASQRVLPNAAEAAGYSFRYPDLPAALASLDL